MIQKQILLAVVSAAVAVGAHAELTTSVEAKQSYDDNIYRIGKKSVDSWITQLRPGLNMQVDQEGSKYSLDLNAESGIYSQSKAGEDNYTDYSARGKGAWQLDDRNKFELGLNHVIGHDDRGTSRTDRSPCIPNALRTPPGGAGCTVVAKSLGTVTGSVAGAPNAGPLGADEPDAWATNGVDAGYTFGTQDGWGELGLKSGFEQKDYTNNSFNGVIVNNIDVSPYGTNALENSKRYVGLLGKMHVASKTSLLLEVFNSDYWYKKTVTDRDSTENKYMVGAEMKGDGAFKGSVRYGYVRRDPDSSTLNLFDTDVWEADLVWAPKSYSTVRFTAFRGVEDGKSAPTLVQVESYGVRWTHKWQKDFWSAIFYDNRAEMYAGIDRDDTWDKWGFSSNYRVNDWVMLSGEYRYEDRDSTGNTGVGLDYDRNVVTVGAELKFK